jgi:DNA adenine methylase
MTKLVSPGKWHGGKTYLASRIIALMPPRCKNPNAPTKDDPGWLCYCEPYFGMGAVLLANDPEGISEVVNDINAELMSFWCVLQNAKTFDAFLRHVQAVPFSEAEWKNSILDLPGDSSFDGYGGISVARAAKFFVRCRQSLAGRMKSFAPLSRNRTRRGMNEQVSAWLNCVEGLPAVHRRLSRVAIVGPKPAVQVICEQDGPRTLTYCDPPYVHSSRSSTEEYGEFEMTEAQHREFLETITSPSRQGRFLVSGYDNPLYREFLGSWNRHEFSISNHAAGGKTKARMTEVVWTNY